MRNSTYIFIGMIFLVLAVLALMFVDASYRERLFAVISMIAACVGWTAFGIVVGQKHSCHIHGPGFMTSLDKIIPVASVTLADSTAPTKEKIMDMYANGGCTYFFKGGGRHGYTFVWRELAEIRAGDDTQIDIKSDWPLRFKKGARPGSDCFNFECLPKELKMALLQDNHWHDKAEVIVFWNKEGYNKMRDVDKNKGMSYQDEYLAANQRISSLETERDTLLETIRKYSQANLSAAIGYQNRNDERQREPDNNVE